MIYKSIADRLRLRLNSSDYNIGSPLPGEKALAKEFGVARMTIRKALDLLVSWGLVERRHGSGTFVARKDVHHETTNLTGLVEVLRQQGKEVQSKVLQFEVMPAPPAIASQLRIQVDERIYFSRRVRYVDGKPLMLEDSFMPVKLFRNLSLAHLEGSKFDYIEKECGITISGNYESLTPVLADKQLAGYMNLPEQTPLLRITSLSYSDSGEFLNYSVMFRNTSDYQVDYHLRRIHPEDLLAHPPEQHRQKLWSNNAQEHHQRVNRGIRECSRAAGGVQVVGKRQCRWVSHRACQHAAEGQIVHLREDARQNTHRQQRNAGNEDPVTYPA